VARDASAVRRDAVRAQPAHPLRDICVIGERHAALGGRDHLDRMKAENGDAAEPAAAHRNSCIAAADRVRGILEDVEPVLLGQMGEVCMSHDWPA
jgi:hypothetical protein